MKRITCFTESLGGGGAEHQLVILAGMLANHGYDVTVVTYTHEQDYYDIPHGVKRIDIGNVFLQGRKLGAILRLLRIFFYFIHLKTDCIISFRQRVNLRLLIPMLFRSHKIKVICSERSVSYNLSFYDKILFNYLYKRADYIVPNSQTQAKIISNISPELKKKIRVIRNYTDLSQFKESTIPTDTSVIRIGVFGRYSKVKNSLSVADAIFELKTKGTKLFELHWYGNQMVSEGGNVYSSTFLSVKKRIEELGISEEFHLHSSAKDPSLLMDSFHAICLASLYEGFSNSISEGICSGKPMLVSNVSDNPLMVHDGENGFLFDPNQPQSIADAIQRFLELSYEEMCLMGKRSREIAESLFDRESFINDYIDLIG